MAILSNVEFENLVSEKHPRLRAIAKQRCNAHPEGRLESEDVHKYISICQHSGDQSAVRWLKNLLTLSKSGKIARMRTGRITWNDKVDLIHTLKASGEIPFDVFDSVIVKETGKRAKVVDYNPDTKMFTVVLDPFQVTTMEKDELQKVGSDEKSKIINDLPDDYVETDPKDPLNMSHKKKLRNK
jgi:hypothetical protein